MQTANAQNKAPIEGDCLIRLLGAHINNENVQELVEYMGTPPPFHHLRGKEMVSTEKGLSIIFDDAFNLVTIILYNSNYSKASRSFNRFEGQLPFELSFKDTYPEMLSKLGKPAKVKATNDSTTYLFKRDLLVNAVCANSGEFFFIRFSLKKKNKEYPFPNKLKCDSLAKQ